MSPDEATSSQMVSWFVSLRRTEFELMGKGMVTYNGQAGVTQIQSTVFGRP
jgi:hypothetical protein